MAEARSPGRPRIGIVEDDPAVRRFFVTTLDGSGAFETAFAANCLAEAREAVRGGAPDLCIVDLGLPDGSGVDLIRELKDDGGVRVLVATVLGDRATVLTALRAGADGYLLKTSSPDDLLNHVRQTLAGFTPISPQVASYLLELLKPAAPVGNGAVLTPRETELLTIFSRGLSYDEAARVLRISSNTVRDFVKKIYAKLQVHSRSEALFEARSLGLIGRDDD